MGAGLFLALNNPNGSGGTAFRSADGNTVGIDLSPIILFGTYNTGTYIFRTNAVDFTAGTFGARSRTLLQTAAFAPDWDLPFPLAGERLAGHASAWPSKVKSRRRVR